MKASLVVAPLVALSLVFGSAIPAGEHGGAGSEAAAANPVVLVHGWNGSASSMAALKWRFEANGRRTFSMTLPGENNATNARALASFIESVKEQTGAAKVDLVAHSMGGLSARYYLKNLGGTASVSEYVSLGSPHYGLLLACFLGTKAGGQMCPFSSFLAALNSGDDTPGSVSYTTIFSTDDGLVPAAASRLGGGACFRQINGVSHTGLAQDAGVFALVLSAVDGTCTGVFR